MPTLVVVAGPNGCGKSTLTRMNGFSELDIIDPDAIARGIASGDSLQAGREALRRRRDALAAGRSHLVETTLAGARGETALITLRNDTAFPHGIHLHGHHFHEVWDDGALGHYRDTTLVDRRVNRDILCVFNNPGKWLLHCHMLGHQESGMRTWVEVA